MQFRYNVIINRFGKSLHNPKPARNLAWNTVITCCKIWQNSVNSKLALLGAIFTVQNSIVAVGGIFVLDKQTNCSAKKPKHSNLISHGKFDLTYVNSAAFHHTKAGGETLQ